MRATVNTRETPRALPKKPALVEANGKAHSTVVGGSNAGLRLRCSASRVEEAKAGRSTNKWADRGTVLHHVIEEALRDDLETATIVRKWDGVSVGPDGTVQLDDIVHTIDLTAELLRQKIAPAIAYFDDVVPQSAKLFLEKKIGLYVPETTPHAESDEIFDAGFEIVDGAFGTGDVIATKLKAPVDEQGRPRYLPGVIDWKFGDGVMVPAADNDQMRFYLVGAIMHGWLPIVPEYVAHIFQPADSLHEDEFGSMAVYTLEDLVRFNRDLKDAIAQPPVHVTGAHCAKCNGRLTCKAFNDLLTTAVVTDVPGMTADELAQQLRLLPAYAKFIEDIKAAALRNAQAGVDIPGYALEPALGNSDWNDAAKAERALALKGVGVHERRVVKTVSPTQALKLLKDLGTPEKEVERFKKTHIYRPNNGEKLVAVKDGDKGNGNPRAAMKRLGAALAARGLS